jgi:hypothetical protein
MYRWLNFVAATAAFTLQMMAACNSADIRVVSKEVPGFPSPVDCNIRLKGQISVGDAKKLKLALSQFKEFANAAPMLCLESDGGDFAEAILIVEAILQPHNHIGANTVVEAHKNCLSACAFIFMAGMECVGTADRCNPARSLDVTARLGFHAPRAEDIPGAQFDDRALGTAYKTAMLQMARLSQSFSHRAESGQYQGTAWVRLTLFSELLQRDANNFYNIDSVAKVGFLDIGLVGVSSALSISKPMLYYACTNKTNWQNGEIGEYNVVDKYRSYDLLNKSIFGRTVMTEGNFQSRVTELSQDVTYKLNLWAKCKATQPLDRRTKQPVEENASLSVDGQRGWPLEGWSLFPGNTSLSQLSDPSFLKRAQAAVE